MAKKQCKLQHDKEMCWDWGKTEQIREWCKNKYGSKTTKTYEGRRQKKLKEKKELIYRTNF